MFLISLFCLFTARVAPAAITSQTHERLAAVMAEHPEADVDKDGVLTFAEYQEYRKSLGPRKRVDGGEAGPISTLTAEGDLLIVNFEENNFGRMRQWGWTIQGDSFARDLAHTARVMKRRVATYKGRYFLSSYADSDVTTGLMRSPSFEIELGFIQFQLSGGEYPGRLGVNLLIDEKVVRSATGRNRDRFQTVAFDVNSLKGKTATLEIVDAHAGIWGHINVDHVVQTERTAAQHIIVKEPVNFGRVTAVVQTTRGRMIGAIGLGNGQLSVGADAIELDDVILAVCDNELTHLGTNGALRLVDGEVWFGQLLGLDDEKVAIQSPLFNRQQVPLKDIASIEFKPGAITGGEPGTLYRTAGEPIPGKLVWIREKDVAIDCALGIVPVPRESIQRLVISRVLPATPHPAVEVGTDIELDTEVGLVDGSLLRGKFKIVAEQVVLEHEILGSLHFDWSTIRYVRRAVKDVVWLDTVNADIQDRIGPVLPPPPPALVRSSDAGFFRAIRMMPKTITHYELPANESNRTLRAVLAPVPGSRAVCKVRVRSGDRTLWEDEVKPGAEPVDLVIDLVDTIKLTIEVDFGDQLAFPCGVDWRDAFVH
jgi:hypothetical protein